MPGGDRTGPVGEGPLTGRRLGVCLSGDKHIYGRGMFYGRNSGRRNGQGRRFGNIKYGWRDYNSEDLKQEVYEELSFLKETASVLEERLNNIEKSLDTLNQNNDD